MANAIKWCKICTNKSSWINQVFSVRITKMTVVYYLLFILVVVSLRAFLIIEADLFTVSPYTQVDSTSLISLPEDNLLNDDFIVGENLGNVKFHEFSILKTFDFEKKTQLYGLMKDSDISPSRDRYNVKLVVVENKLYQNRVDKSLFKSYLSRRSEKQTHTDQVLDET